MHPHDGHGTSRAATRVQDRDNATGQVTPTELERFREEWRHDLQARRGGGEPIPSSSGEAARPPAPEAHEDEEMNELTASMRRAFTRNLEDYATAVVYETSGNLDEALDLYRASFRADPDIDRTFQTAVHLCQDPAAQKILAQDEGMNRAAEKVLKAAGSGGLQQFGKSTHRTPSPSSQRRSRRDTDAQPPDGVEPAAEGDKDSLESLHARAVKLREKNLRERALSSSPEEAPRWLHDIDELAAADVEVPCPLKTLPDELLFHILYSVAVSPAGRGTESHDRSASGAKVPKRLQRQDQDSRRSAIDAEMRGVDHWSLENLARVCWKLRLLTLDPRLWHALVHHVYKPPQLAPEITPRSLLNNFAGRWRQMYRFQPRLRQNGVYIASCRYSRTGMHEDNVWVNVIHVIEFYRYFRFLPDGRCLTLQCTEPPSEIVRMIEPKLKRKGFAIGTWQLHPAGLPDDHTCGRPPGPKVEVTSLLDDSMPNIRFRWILHLRNGGAVGKWNKLDMLEYRSINLRTGDDEPLSHKHARPFYFSVVKSYQT